MPAKVAGVEPTSQTRLLHAHADLPDPVTNVLQALVDEIEALRKRVAELEGRPEDPVVGREHEMAEFEGHD